MTNTKAIIQFVKNFDLDNAQWEKIPKGFAHLNGDEVPDELITKFLSMKTLYELKFGRDLKQEKEVKPHGGYKTLEAFKMAEIVYDFTFEFCQKYTTYTTYKSYKTVEQMVGAARSGKQNIAEGSQRAAESSQSERYLIDVARASLQELLEDYNDFLRTNKLRKWSKDDPRVRAIRALAYGPNKSYTTYKSYMASSEAAANCAITIINQTNYLLDRLLARLRR